MTAYIWFSRRRSDRMTDQDNMIQSCSYKPYDNAKSTTTTHPATGNQVISVLALPPAPFSGFPVGVAEFPAADEAPSATVTISALLAADETLPLTVTVFGPPVTTPADGDAVIANVVEGPDRDIYE